MIKKKRVLAFLSQVAHANDPSTWEMRDRELSGRAMQVQSQHALSSKLQVSVRYRVRLCSSIRSDYVNVSERSAPAISEEYLLTEPANPAFHGALCVWCIELNSCTVQEETSVAAL